MDAKDVAFLERGRAGDCESKLAFAVDVQREYLCALPQLFSEFRFLLSEA